jgi:hypothetical protein
MVMSAATQNRKVGGMGSCSRPPFHTFASDSKLSITGLGVHNFLMITDRGRTRFKFVRSIPGRSDAQAVRKQASVNRRPVQSDHQRLRQRRYPQPPPPIRRRINSKTIAPIKALTIRPTIPTPR